LEDVPIGEAFDPAITVRRPGKQPVADRALIDKVGTTWRALEELSGRTEAMLTGREVAVVGE
jgi:hypothetical protein